VFIRSFVFVVAACMSVACSTPPAGSAASSSGASAGAAAASTAPVPAPDAAGADSGTVTGVVAETMNSGGYTYARLTRAGGETWMAAAEFPIVQGATITAAVDMPMRNFHSRTLNREFSEIYFVRDVVMNGAPVAATSAASGGAGADAPAMAGSHGGSESAAPEEPEEPKLIAAVTPAPGSVTIADVWAKRQALSGKPLVLRGQIVKVNLAIMGANWYHLQDGSGVVKDGTHDLVVTSAGEFKAGDVVTVNGTLTTDKDFGAGYSYEAIVENADIRK